MMTVEREACSAKCQVRGGGGLDSRKSTPQITRARCWLRRALLARLTHARHPGQYLASSWYSE